MQISVERSTFSLSLSIGSTSAKRATAAGIGGLYRDMEGDMCIYEKRRRERAKKHDVCVFPPTQVLSLVSASKDVGEKLAST